MGAGSTVPRVAQDAKSFARARHHVPKFLGGFVLPHAVIAEMGYEILGFPLR